MGCTLFSFLLFLFLQNMSVWVWPCFRFRIFFRDNNDKSFCKLLPQAWLVALSETFNIYLVQFKPPLITKTVWFFNFLLPTPLSLYVSDYLVISPFVYFNPIIIYFIPLWLWDNIVVSVSSGRIGIDLVGPDLTLHLVCVLVLLIVPLFGSKSQFGVIILRHFNTSQVKSHSTIS